MYRFPKGLSAAAAPLILSGLLAAPAARAAYPERTVEIVDGSAPGGTTDLISRLMAKKLAERWGQPVVVVNRPGADLRIAAAYTANSKPDGYTIMMMVNDLVMPDPPGVKITYDIVKSFTHVVSVATVPNCLIVKSTFPANTLKDVIATAKAKPDTLNFSVNGTGAPAQIAWERLMRMTGTHMEFLHYQGSAPKMMAVVSGEAQITNVPCSTAMSQVKGGTVKVLAITEKSDLPQLASVPKFEEASGLPYDGGGSNWYGLIVPVATPADVVANIRAAALDVLQQPDVKQIMANQFIFPATAAESQQDFVRLVKTDIVRWADWAKENQDNDKKN